VRMGEEQRKIYNSLKRPYGRAVLDRIAKEGVRTRSIDILEGDEVRQICDSRLCAGAGNWAGGARWAGGGLSGWSAKLEE